MALDSYVGLGRSGLKVSPFCLGAMNFGEDGGMGCDAEESAGAGRKAVLGQLEDSLRRLRTDYIDLYWLHNYDWSTPVEETLRTLDDLVTAGSIRYVGFSDTPAWFTAKAHTMALLRGWTPVTALQMEYSLLERTIEGELIPLAQDAGMGVLPWSPLKSGFLSGKYTRGNAIPAGTRRSAVLGAPSEAQYTVIDALAAVAEEVGASPAAVALAWVHGRPGVSSTIIGPRRIDHLEANLAGLEVKLTEEQIAVLDDVSAPTLNFPAELNRKVGPMLKYAGATVDGQATFAYPPLLESTTRY
jgi:aryl-alcohol dehydrogenase-like predicted oxidoreductase